MKLTQVTGIVFSAFFAMSIQGLTLAHADMYSSLSPDDQAAINNGEQVTPDPQDVDGSAWPKVTVYQRVEATPDQVAAIMFDFSLHKTMFGPVMDGDKVSKPGITASAAVNPGAVATDINYTMVFPKVLGIGLPAEEYTVHDVLSSTTPGAYQITWNFVKASSMKDTSGVAAFEKLGTGTLIGYTNFINPPKPPLARLIVKMYVQQVKDTVTSLINQVLSERAAANQSQLTAQVASLNHALNP